VVSGCGRTISAHSLGKEIVCAIVRGITHGLCRSSFQGLTFSKIWAAKRLDAWSCLSLGSCSEARSREPPIGILTGFHSRQNRRYRLVHGNWPSQFFRHKSQAPWRPSKREREEKKSRSFDCKRSFSFAEISHGCRNRKGSLCTYVYNQPCAAVSQD
jgi:hypothetical protein